MLLVLRAVQSATSVQIKSTTHRRLVSLERNSLNKARLLAILAVLGIIVLLFNQHLFSVKRGIFVIQVHSVQLLVFLE